MNPLQFSFSFLSQDDNCPEAARHLFVLRTYKKSFAKLEGGIDDHKVLEQRLRYKEPLPSALQKAEPLVVALEQRGEPRVEVSLGVDRNLQPIGFWDGWLRGKYDVTVKLAPTRGFIGDWKSGKIRESSDQLEIGALLWFAADAELQEVTGANLWLRSAEIGAAPKLGVPYTFKREDSGRRWAKWLARMNTIEKRDPTKEWERREGALCSWCPIKVCPHYRGA